MSFSETLARTLLGPAVEAGRRALRRLEATEVPTELAKVASYTGGKLPPPLAKSLVHALDTDPWLRAKAIDEFEEHDVDSERPSIAASSLFLLRPYGWWDPLTRLGQDADESSAAAETTGLQAQVDEMRATLDEAKRREKAMRDSMDQAAKASRRTEKGLRKQLGAERTVDEMTADRLVADASEAVEQVELAEAGAAEAGRAAGALRELLRRVRRERADLERRLQQSTSSSGSARLEVLDLARSLDEVATRARPLVERSIVEQPTTPALGLPGGFAPTRLRQSTG